MDLTACTIKAQSRQRRKEDGRKIWLCIVEYKPTPSAKETLAKAWCTEEPMVKTGYVDEYEKAKGDVKLTLFVEVKIPDAA